MNRAAEMFPRYLGQQRGVPWTCMPSPEGEDLAEEQQCRKAPREFMDAEINPNQVCDLAAKLWDILKEIIIPFYFALLRPQPDAVPSLVQEVLINYRVRDTKMLRSGAFFMCRDARGSDLEQRKDFGWS